MWKEIKMLNDVVTRDDFQECLENDSLIFLDPSLGEDDPIIHFLGAEVGFYSLKAKNVYLN